MTTIPETRSAHKLLCSEALNMSLSELFAEVEGKGGTAASVYRPLYQLRISVRLI